MKKIQIFSIFVLIFYFTPKFLKIKGITDNVYYDIVCFIAIICIAFLEIKRLIKLDKTNNTHKFNHRILLVLFALIILIIAKMLFFS